MELGQNSCKGVGSVSKGEGERGRDGWQVQGRRVGLKRNFKRGRGSRKRWELKSK